MSCLGTTCWYALMARSVILLSLLLCTRVLVHRAPRRLYEILRCATILNLRGQVTATVLITGKKIYSLFFEGSLTTVVISSMVVHGHNVTFTVYYSYTLGFILQSHFALFVWKFTRHARLIVIRDNKSFCSRMIYKKKNSRFFAIFGNLTVVLSGYKILT